MRRTVSSSPYLLLSACLTLLLGSAAALGAETSWSSAYTKGENALQANKPSLAVENFRRALNLVQKQSKDKAQIDDCSLKLAAALSLSGKFVEARSVLENLLNSVVKADGNKSPRIRLILMKLGSIMESAGDHSAAMDYYKRALQITEESYGPFSPEAAAAFRGLGRTNSKLGNTGEATNNYQRAISILSKDPNQESADELKRIMHEYKDLIKGNDDSNNDLIKDFQKDILKNDGTPKGPANKSDNSSQFQQQTEFKLKARRSSDTGEDEKIALRGLPISSSADLNPAFKVVNDTIANQSRYKFGEEQYQRMIATDINALGPHHPSVANDLKGLAQVYLAQGRYKEAKELLIKALAVYDSAYGAKNLLSISTTASLALAETELGNKDQAINLYSKALSNAQESLGPGSIETAKISNGLAYLYFQQGQLDRSSTMYEWALASTKQAVGDKDPLLAACLRDYAQVLRRLDQNNKANELELRAGQIVGQ